MINFNKNFVANSKPVNLLKSPQFIPNINANIENNIVYKIDKNFISVFDSKDVKNKNTFIPLRKEIQYEDNYWTRSLLFIKNFRRK